MAVSFKNSNFPSQLTTSLQTIYTTPALTEAVVFSGTITNDHASTATLFDIVIFTGGGVNQVEILSNIPLSPGSTFTIPKIVLEANDFLQAKADDGFVVSINLNILEQS